MRHYLVSALFLFVAFSFNISAVSAQSVDRFGKEYTLVPYSQLVEANGAWGWEIDGPTIFAGQRVATIGWMDAIRSWRGGEQVCAIWLRSALSKAEDQNGIITGDPAQVRLDWDIYLNSRSEHPPNRSSLYQARRDINAGCEEVVAEQGKNLEEIEEVLIIVYGVVQNGSGKRQIACNRAEASTTKNEFVRGCNHIIVEHMEFAGVVRDRKDQMAALNNALLSDFVRLGADYLLRRVMPR